MSKVAAKKLRHQTSWTTTEQFRENQTGNDQVPFPKSSNCCPTDIQETEKHQMTSFNGVNDIPLLKITTPDFGEKIVRRTN